MESQEYFRQFVSRIKSREAVVGIIGLGYVGLPLMLRCAEVGFKIIGFDIDKQKVKALSSGESYIAHISAESIKKVVQNGSFLPTTEMSKAKECDALLICVPTPLNKYREPNISFVTNTMDALLPYIRPGQLIALESTTYPGTTDEELKTRLESVGRKVGEDVFLVFSPEREDPGNPNFTTRTIPKIVGGDTPACKEAGVSFYSSIIDQVVPVSSSRTAEMVKLLENIHRAVNIGLVNEMKIVADRMDIDIHEVIKAAATKPFGFTAYYPGPGLGGHCIPIDPFYLTWKAREYDLNTRFIELAGEVNTSMPRWVVQKVTDALNDRGQALKDAKILVLGIAYKKDVDDMRESPSVRLMELLRDKGAKISYSDPYVPTFPKMREHHFDLNSVSLTEESLAGFDCVLLATNHSSFDYPMIKKNSKLIVDTRGVFLDPAPNIVKS